MQPGWTRTVLNAGSRATKENMKSLALVWGVVLLFMVPAQAQRPGSGERDKSLKIPFEYASNRDSLLVRVRINERPAILILDTGSAHTVLRPEAVGIPRSKLISARSSRSGAGFMGDAVSKEVTLQIGERVSTRHHVVLMDLSDILAAYQENLDGVLGLDFLQQYSRVVVDLRERKIYLIR
jgi:hypothetical protein